jgi:hypothetical protein
VVCSSGIGFDPVIRRRRLTFGFHGIYQGTAVLYDHLTRSLWMHFTGECFQGSYEGTVLRRLSTGRHTTWEDWVGIHPATQVIAPDRRYINRRGDRGYFSRTGAESGAPYLPETFVSTIQTRDDRLGLHDLVYGVVVGETARAYPFADLPAVVEETVGGVAVTVWFDAASRSVAAFERDEHSFAALPEGLREDRATKSRWNMEGECVAGPLRGERLEPLHGLMAEWYGWAAHYPRTTVWRRRGSATAEPASGR